MLLIFDQFAIEGAKGILNDFEITELRVIRRDSIDTRLMIEIESLDDVIKLMEAIEEFVRFSEEYAIDYIEDREVKSLKVRILETQSRYNSA